MRPRRGVAGVPAGRRGGRRRPAAVSWAGDAGGVERGEERRAEAVDGGDLVRRRHEVDRRGGVGEADREVVVAGRPASAVAGVGRAGAGRTACSGARASGACRRASPTRAGGRTRRSPGGRGGRRCRRATPPARRRSGGVSLSITAATRSPASTHDVGAVIAPGQLGQIGAHAVDEGVDVLGEGPGHGGAAYWASRSQPLRRRAPMDSVPVR